MFIYLKRLWLDHESGGVGFCGVGVGVQNTGVFHNLQITKITITYPTPHHVCWGEEINWWYRLTSLVIRNCFLNHIKGQIGLLYMSTGLGFFPKEFSIQHPYYLGFSFATVIIDDVFINKQRKNWHIEYIFHQLNIKYAKHNKINYFSCSIYCFGINWG